MNSIRSRSIAARAGLVLGIAALVVAGGLLAGLRGGEESPATQAAPSAVRATLDPVTSLTGDAAQVSELQSRLQLHPANAQLQGALGIAYLQRARETNDPSYYAKAQTLLGKSLKRDPAGLDATIGAGSLALSHHDFRDALRLGRRALTLSNGFSPAALGMIGDASVELGRYEQGFAAFEQLGELRPGLVAYARLSYSRELVGDIEGATRLMRQAVAAGSGAPENTQWTRVQLASLLLKSGRIDAAAREYRHALALLPNYARAEAGLGAVAVARGNLAQAEQLVRPRRLAPAAARDRRAARRRARGARRYGRRARGLRARPPRAGPVRPLRRQRRPRDRALRGVPPGRALAGIRRRARAQGARRPPVDLRARFTRLGAVLGRQVPPGSASGHAREPPRHDRSAALVAPRRDRRLRRASPASRAPRSSARSRGIRASTRSTPRRRSGCWRSSHDGQVALAASATWPLRRRSRPWRSPPCPCGRRGAPARQLHDQPVHAPRRRAGRTCRCATCSTWPRCRRSSGGRSSTRTATGVSGRASARASATPRRARDAASAAHGRRQARAARARDCARGLPAGAGRAQDDAAGRALPRRRARARRRAAHAEALEHLRDRSRRLARAAGRPRRGRRGAFDRRLRPRSHEGADRLPERPAALAARRPLGDDRGRARRRRPRASRRSRHATPTRPATASSVGEGRRRLRLADRERRRADAVRRARGARPRARVRDVPRAHAGPRQDDGGGLPRRHARIGAPCADPRRRRSPSRTRPASSRSASSRSRSRSSSSPTSCIRGSTSPPA